ncbi:MAG: hypothetical protein IH939_13355 [Acidobacteria bacterium]|nr:hypothetical protein [Acidobacteriota bacterium]
MLRFAGNAALRSGGPFERLGGASEFPDLDGLPSPPGVGQGRLNFRCSAFERFVRRFNRLLTGLPRGRGGQILRRLGGGAMRFGQTRAYGRRKPLCLVPELSERLGDFALPDRRCLRVLVGVGANPVLLF